ncbi:MAG: hypothetical protein A2341_25120 [Deltaproteobacteria bacterium RIFOXYB12_FULL_58_9]|nr:MAG: hypothetical protein A2341_25120 [Deltaproteobacteria bacterium RIFOXYB12_FULL_58_9]
MLATVVALAACLHSNLDTFGDRTVIRAITAAAAGDNRGALDALRPVLGTKRDGTIWPAARFFAARAALTVGEPTEALTLLDGLEVQIPEAVDFICAAQATALRMTGQWEHALGAWQCAMATVNTPLLGAALYGVADAHYALGQINEAQRAYQHALREAPKLDHASTARFNIAVIDEARRRWLEAASGYTAIVYYRPTDPLAHVAQARLAQLVAAGRAPKASFGIRIARIDRLLKSRRFDDAQQELSEIDALATSPSRRTSIKARKAQLAYYLRDSEVAQKLYAELAESSHGWRKRSYEMWVARCLSSTNKNAEAIRAYLALADKNKNEQEGREALFKAAWLAYNSREHEQAVRHFGEFLERYPTDTAVDEVLWYLSWNAYRLDDLQTAYTTLERLRRELPRSPLVQGAIYWQGRILEHQGYATKAAEQYKLAFDHNPLDYYALLATRRLRGGVDMTAIVGAALVATTGDPRGLVSDKGGSGAELRASPEPSVDELPEGGRFEPLSTTRLPWGGAIFDWNNPLGRRALVLIELGLHHEAADLVQNLPIQPGHEASSVHYARARLLYGLGDFATAYKLTLANFRKEISTLPAAQTRHLFHIAYPTAFEPLVQSNGAKYGVSPLLLLAVMRQESAFETRARSWAAAMGLMQIIPPTGQRIASALGVEQFDAAMLNLPAVNVQFGAWYLSGLVSKYHGHLPLAIASYNAGPSAVTKWVDTASGIATDEFIEEIPYRETRQYVKRVLSNLQAYDILYDDGFVAVPEVIPDSYGAEPSF